MELEDKFMIKKINEEFLKTRLQNILKSSQELVTKNISTSDYVKSKEEIEITYKLMLNNLRKQRLMGKGEIKYEHD